MSSLWIRTGISQVSDGHLFGKTSADTVGFLHLCFGLRTASGAGWDDSGCGHAAGPGGRQQRVALAR